MYDQASGDDGGIRVDWNANVVSVLALTESANGNFELSKLKYQDGNGVLQHNYRTQFDLPGLHLADLEDDSQGNHAPCGRFLSNNDYDAFACSLGDTLGTNWLDTLQGLGYNDRANDLAVNDSDQVIVLGTCDSVLNTSTVLLKSYHSDGTVKSAELFDSLVRGKKAGGLLNVDQYGMTVMVNQFYPYRNPNVHIMRADHDTIARGDLWMQKNGYQVMPIAKFSWHADSFVVLRGIATDSTFTLNAIGYSGWKRPMDLVEDTINGDYFDNQHIWRFKPKALKTSFTDDTTKTFGWLKDVVTDSTLDTLSGHLGWHLTLDSVRVKKVYSGLTSAYEWDTSYSGDTVWMPPLWCTLVLFYADSVDEDTVQVFSDSLLNGHVDFVEKVLPIKLYSFPNDSLIDSFFHYYNSNSFENDWHINLKKAWTIEKGSYKTRVGVFDSGVYWDHQDLCDDTVGACSKFGRVGLNPKNRVRFNWILDGSDDMLTSTYATYHSDGKARMDDQEMNGHGTAVAGVIGATTNNGEFGAGVAGGDYANGERGVSIYSYQVFKVIVRQDNDGSWKERFFDKRYKCDGNTCSRMATNDELDDLLENSWSRDKIHIANYSWGYGWNQNTDKDLKSVREAFQLANKMGMLHVAASGNLMEPDRRKDKHWKSIEQPAPIFPASFYDDGILKVGALDRIDGDNVRAHYSYFGHDLDLLAPSGGHPDSDYPKGIMLLQSRKVSAKEPLNPPSPTTWNLGTSFSAPQVAGVAALMITYHERSPIGVSHLYPEDIEWIIEQSALDIDYEQYEHDVDNRQWSETAYPGYDSYTGHGRLNAFKALQMVSRPNFKIKHYERAATSQEISGMQKVETNKWIEFKNSGASFTTGKKYKGDVYKLTIEITGDWPDAYQGTPYVLVTGPSSFPFVKSPGWWGLNAHSDVYSYDFNGRKMYLSSDLFAVGSGQAYSVTVNGVKKIRAQVGGYFFKRKKDNKWYPFDPNNKEVKMGFGAYFNLQDVGLNATEPGNARLELYPNPTAQNLTLVTYSSEPPVSLRILDLQGREVSVLRPQKYRETYQLDVSYLRNGLYVVEARYVHETVVKKFIKE